VKIMAKKAALIKGDGVGPELTAALIKVLDAVGSPVELVECDAGSEWWAKHGGSTMIPEDSWKVINESDACFKAPTTTPPDPSAPRSVAVSIRQAKQLYANIRPIRTIGPVKQPLDFVCVREATEGLYSGIEYRLTDEVSIAIRKTTRQGSERVARKAFQMAVERGWTKVVAVTKRNILKETDGIFMRAVEDIAKEYPGISVEEYYVDNMAQQLVKNPERFNQTILLSTNLFMDIISEAASGHLGSIGMVYSGNFGDNYAMFEPAHGSAPKYKGQDKVNPTATILAGAWMLRYLGYAKHAEAIFNATERLISEGKHLTYDLGGSAGTSEMANAIAVLSARLLS